MAETKETFRFPCSNCGANLRYQPGTETLVCEFCGTTNTVPQIDRQARDIRERDFLATLKTLGDTAETTEIRIAKCNNCGAEIEFDATTHATECPFCASPIVVDTGPQRKIKPAALLPFGITQEDARAAMTTWLGKLWFAPSGLKEYARKGRELQGIYVPFWTYDADTKSRYWGQRGTIYYVTKSVRVEVNGHMETRQEQVQKIRWTPASGRVARAFDDVLVLAATSLPKSYTDALAPWDLSALEPYRPDYLAGFRAEGYTVALERGYEEARVIMDRMIERDVRFDIGGDRQRIERIDTTLSNVTFKHILLPVWTAAYKYRGKSYRFVVNGRSGTVKGERPWSWVKITLAALLAALIAGIIAYFYMQNR